MGKAVLGVLMVVILEDIVHDLLHTGRALSMKKLIDKVNQASNLC